MALAAVGNHRVAGNLTAGRLFFMSDNIGKGWNRLRERLAGPVQEPVRTPFRIVQ
jgi:hypothetical protein